MTETRCLCSYEQGALAFSLFFPKCISIIVLCHRTSESRPIVVGKKSSEASVVFLLDTVDRDHVGGLAAGVSGCCKKRSVTSQYQLFDSHAHATINE